MLQKRTFNIVLVNREKGTGIDTPARFDKTIVYSGKALTIKM
jgi:hypothetical protein